MTLDNDELNGILEHMEEDLNGLVGSFGLPEATVERWPRDEPAVSLSWVGPDLNSRNVNGLIVVNDGSPQRILIEANAWRDVDSSDGITRSRLWRCQKFGEFEVRKSMDIPWDEVKQFETEACSTVIKWGLSADVACLRILEL